MSTSTAKASFGIALLGMEKLVRASNDFEVARTADRGISALIIKQVEDIALLYRNILEFPDLEHFQQLAAILDRMTSKNDKVALSIKRLGLNFVRQRIHSHYADKTNSNNLTPTQRVHDVEQWLEISRLASISFNGTENVIDHADDIIFEKFNAAMDHWPGTTVFAMEMLALVAKLIRIPGARVASIQKTAASIVSFLEGKDIQAEIVEFEEIRANTSSKPPYGTDSDDSSANSGGQSLQAQNNELREAITELHTKNSDLQQKDNDSRANTADLSKQLSELSLSKEALQEEINKLKNTKGSHQNHIRKLNGELAEHKSALADAAVAATYHQDLQNEVLKIKEQLSEAEEDQRSVIRDNNKLVENQGTLEDAIAAASHALASSTETNEELRSHKNGVEQSLAELVRDNSQSNELRNELAVANARLKERLEGPTKAREEEMAIHNEMIATGRDNLIKDLDESRGIIEDLKRQRTDLVKGFDDLDVENAGLRTKLTNMILTLDEALSSITATNMAKLTSENLRLEEQLADANKILGQITTSLRPRHSSGTATPQPLDNRSNYGQNTRHHVDQNEAGYGAPENTESDICSLVTPCTSPGLGNFVPADDTVGEWT